MYIYKTKALLKLNEELFKSIKKNDIKKVKRLIKRGADVNACDDWGCYPIHYAGVEHVDARMSKVLIENGANPNQRTDKSYTTPLHWACSWYIGKPPDLNAIGKIIILINNGSDVNAKDADGKTPLDVASECGNLDAVALLCKFPSIYGKM